MKNHFYSPFDFQRKEDLKKNEEEVRSPFQIDRDRIIFSYAFRRLQSKTQVFQSGEYDFYRNRLTHSIEVAKIGRSIAEFHNEVSDYLSPEFSISTDLVEAIGLSHDLGHPPFGHIGERKLNKIMAEFGGFEGNAQTLRIVTQLFYNRPEGSQGMNPTRALVDGVMKYKSLQCDLVETNSQSETSYPKNHFLYDEDRCWLEFVEDVASGSQRAQFGLKSLECQIMDWADDTAYSINDIIDSIQAGYLTPEKIESWAENANLDKEDSESVHELIQTILGARHESFLNRQIGQFIRATHIAKAKENSFSNISNRYGFVLEIDPLIQQKAELYKKLAVDLIFRSTQIQRIEYKGGLILEKLYEALQKNYLESPKKSQLSLIPKRFQVELANKESEREKMRILCDCVAEMTDALAVKTYKQLFDPDFGSILDII
ncbi:MAG: dNTP triphosphohydrolase [Opitutales bacterium]|nr:dNTP triphosphohydrolase [Opitutales bacterium]